MQDIITRNEYCAAEVGRWQHMRGGMSKHPSSFILHERECDARCEPRRRSTSGSIPTSAALLASSASRSNADNIAVSRCRRVEERAQLVEKRMPHGRTDGFLEGGKDRPRGAYEQILADAGRVFHRDSLEALQMCGELFEVGQVPRRAPLLRGP